MRPAAVGIGLLLMGYGGSAQGEVGAVDPAAARLGSIPALVARFAPPDPPRSRLHLHLGHVSPIRTVAGGIDASPFVTALPGEMWHGRLRSFGAASGTGLAGSAVRARSIGFSGLQSERHVSGFLASELRYGIGVDEDDLLTVDLNAAWQRMPPISTIGRGKSIRMNSLYVGAALIHDRRLSLTGGWYRLAVTSLPAFDYAIERTAGMPAAGEGLRLGCDWQLGERSTVRPAQIGLEMRDGDADRDRLMPFAPASGRERRLLLRFTAPF